MVSAGCFVEALERLLYCAASCVTAFSYRDSDGSHRALVEKILITPTVSASSLDFSDHGLFATSVPVQVVWSSRNANLRDDRDALRAQ